MKTRPSFHVDLIYHLLAHLNLKDNASNLYSNEYIEYIEKEKIAENLDISLRKDLHPLLEKYSNGFQRLCLINFMPFYTNDLEETKNILLENPIYTADDKENFLIPFFNIANKEKDEFYSKFWCKELKNYSHMINEFNIYIEEKMNKFNNVFHFYNAKPNIYLSLSLTQSGRGFYCNKCFSAAVKMPRNNKEFSSIFIQAFHEMTHQFTDKLISKKISMDNGTHNLSESLAIVTDFYLFQKYNTELLKDYCDYFGIRECSEDSMTEKYPLSLDVLKRIQKLLLEL